MNEGAYLQEMVSLLVRSLNHQDERITLLQDRVLALEMMANREELAKRHSEIESLNPIVYDPEAQE
jgi:hypothetical protein